MKVITEIPKGVFRDGIPYHGLSMAAFAQLKDKDPSDIDVMYEIISLGCDVPITEVTEWASKSTLTDVADLMAAIMELSAVSADYLKNLKGDLAAKNQNSGTSI